MVWSLVSMVASLTGYEVMQCEKTLLANPALSLLTVRGF